MRKLSPSKNRIVFGLLVAASFFLICFGIVIAAIRYSEDINHSYLEAECNVTTYEVLTDSNQNCVLSAYVYFIQYIVPYDNSIVTSAIGSASFIDITRPFTCYFDVTNLLDVQWIRKSKASDVVYFNLLSGIPFALGFVLWFPIWLSWLEYKKNVIDTGSKGKLKTSKKHCFVLVLAILFMAGFIIGIVMCSIYSPTGKYLESDCNVTDVYFTISAGTEGKVCIPHYEIHWDVTLIHNREPGMVTVGPVMMLDEITPYYYSKKKGEIYDCFYEGSSVVWDRVPLWPFILLAVGCGIMFLAILFWVISQYRKKRKSLKIFDAPIGKYQDL